MSSGRFLLSLSLFLVVFLFVRLPTRHNANTRSLTLKRPTGSGSPAAASGASGRGSGEDAVAADALKLIDASKRAPTNKAATELPLPAPTPMARMQFMSPALECIVGLACESERAS